MKIFRSTERFIPSSTINIGNIVIMPNTDYDVIDTNQAFGIYIKVFTGKEIFEKVFISREEFEKYAVKQDVLTNEKIREILDNITFPNSCINFEWGWEIVEINGNTNSLENKSSESIRGFLINTTFKRPDVISGIMGIGRGRRMWIEETASETSVVMTAFVCVKLIVEHEILEGFTYKDAKILNPHKSLEELAYPQLLVNKKEASLI